jgi:hypothetical protein
VLDLVLLDLIAEQREPLFQEIAEQRHAEQIAGGAFAAAASSRTLAQSAAV